MISHTVAIALVGALAMPAAAAAEPPSPQGAALRELSLEQLGSLEVTTVSKQPAEVWRSAAAIFVLTQEDIRRSGATILPEVLRLVPGVQVSRLDSDHWAIGIRGLTEAFSKSLLLLIDGRSVYTPLFGGVFWDVQDTLVEDIERIEVIRGPGGTIWGANAVNGVINVITRNSRDTVGTLASVGGGNVDRGRVGVRFGGAHGDALHYRVYGSGFSRSAEYHPDGRNYDDWRIGQAGFRIDAGGTGGDAFVLQGDVYNGRVGEQVGVGSFFPPAQLVVEGDDRVSGGNILARWQHDLAGGADFRLQAYFDRTSRRAPHFEETRNTFDIDVLHHTPLGRRHNVSLGAGARVNPSHFTTIYPTLTVVPEDRGHHIVSAFAQDEIAVVGEKVWLTLGSKFEHTSDAGLDVQPSVRFLWRPNARETVWTSVARAVRTPSRVDTDLRLLAYAGATTLPVYVSVVGSEDFRSESLLGFEAGYRRLIASQVYLDVTAFHNDYDDLAGFGPGTVSVAAKPILHALLAVPYVNAVGGTTDGLEISPDWRPASWLQVKSAYAFLTSDMTAHPGSAADSQVVLYEGSSPRHQGFVGASLELPGRIEFDHTYRFMSRLRAHDIPGYVTADARLGWQLPRGMTVAIVGQNLLQDHHAEFFPDARPLVGIRRSVYASVTWRR
jgi:iron complex outermembrane recepter protein